MFPIDSNDAYRNADGSLTTMGEKIESGGSGGGSDIPEYSTSDAGKVLTVGDDGDGLKWNVIDPFSKYGVYAPYVAPAPIFKPSNTSGKYNIGLWTGSITSSGTRSFDNGNYDLDECFIGDAAAYHEFYNYLTSDVIEHFDMELLYDGVSAAVSGAELLHNITDYDFLVLQGCYDSSGTSQYDTTIIYSNINLSDEYFFGVKDRNSSYSGILSFTDDTHVTLSASRRIRIFGFNK